jgi:hypothetical protein
VPHGEEHTGQSDQSGFGSRRGSVTSTLTLIQAFFSESSAHPISAPARIGQRRLGAVSFGPDGWRWEWQVSAKEILTPNIIESTGAFGRRFFIPSAIFTQRLVDTDHEPCQRRCVSEGVHAGELRHTALALAFFVITARPEVEDGHTEIGIALDWNQDRRGIGTCRAVAKR